MADAEPARSLWAWHPIVGSGIAAEQPEPSTPPGCSSNSYSVPPYAEPDPDATSAH